MYVHVYVMYVPHNGRVNSFLCPFHFYTAG